jgi:uncharacterized protein YajQ (UPF0234 family)
MNIDLAEYSVEDAAEILRAEIVRRGLDPSTMKILVDNIKHDQPTRKMSFTFHFEIDRERMV